MPKDVRVEKEFLIIILLGCVVFANGLFNRFVNDDLQQIVNNPIVHSLSNIGTIFRGGTFFNGTTSLAGVYYKPVTLTVYTVLYQLFGENYTLYHLLQILIHIANTGILLLIFLRFFRKQIAFIVALLFLVHPVNTESVLYISAMQEVLYFFFGFLALWISMSSGKTNYLFIVFLLLGLSILSKETGILFLPVIYLYLLLFRKKDSMRFLRLIIPFFLLYVVLRHQTTGIFVRPPVSPIDYLSLPERLTNAPFIVWTYIRLIFFPLNLSSSYNFAYTSAAAAHFYVSLLADLIVAGVFIWLGYRVKEQFRTYIFFGVWTVLGFSILLHIVPLDMTLAERWLYFPLVGVFGLFSLFFERIRMPDKLLISMAVITISVFSVRTIVRTFDWRDNFTLAQHDISVSSDNYDLENVIGVMLTEEKNYDEAIKHIKRSIRIHPNFQNYNNLAIIYTHQGKYKEAKETYETSLSLNESYMTYENLAYLGMLAHDPSLGKEFVRSAVIKYPLSHKLWTALAILEYKDNNATIAAQAITNAYNLSRDEQTAAIYSTIISGKQFHE